MTLPHLWIAGALFVVGIDTFVRRQQRHVAPHDFWLESLETFLFLAGLMAVVKFAVWLVT